MTADVWRFRVSVLYIIVVKCHLWGARGDDGELTGEEGRSGLAPKPSGSSSSRMRLLILSTPAGNSPYIAVQRDQIATAAATAAAAAAAAAAVFGFSWRVFWQLT